MTQPKSEQYPEMEKVRQVQDQSQKIGEFLEWLFEQHTLCEVTEYAYTDVCSYCGEVTDVKGYMPVRKSIEELLAGYFGIDLKRYEEEKRQLLDEERKRHAEEETGTIH